MTREKAEKMKLQAFYNHNEKEASYYLVTVQRNGNDKNGNPIYLINIFDGTNLDINYNCMAGRKLDKYGNIRIQSYNVDASVQSIINQL